MTRTDTEHLDPPNWLRPTSSREHAVLEHTVAVQPEWWHQALDRVGLAAEAPQTVALCRADLFALADDAAESATGARRLLWACLSWGTGRRHRNNLSRIESIAHDPQHTGELLRRAAHAAAHDPAAAYELLWTGRPAIKHLGPPFFTKFFYAAGGGHPEHPCLILDSTVATALQHQAGWSSLHGRSRWPVDTYRRYCQLLHRWAHDLSTPARRVAADEIEKALFDRAPES